MKQLKAGYLGVNMGWHKGRGEWHVRQDELAYIKAKWRRKKSAKVSKETRNMMMGRITGR